MLLAHTLATPITGWTMITLVYDTSKRPNLYVDGVFIKTGVSSARSPRLFMGNLGLGPYGSYTGSIDDVRVFRRALGAQEITSLYELFRPPPVLHFAFEALPGGRVLSEVGDITNTNYAATATSLSASNIVSGRLGSALRITSDSQFITPESLPEMVNRFSVSVWVKPSTTTFAFGAQTTSSTSGTSSSNRYLISPQLLSGGR